MDRFTVFLIDDDIGTLTALSGFLRAAGYGLVRMTLRLIIEDPK